MQRGLENAGVSLETYVGAGMPHVFPVFASFIYGTNPALLRKAGGEGGGDDEAALRARWAPARFRVRECGTATTARSNMSNTT